MLGELTNANTKTTEDSKTRASSGSQEESLSPNNKNKKINYLDEKERRKRFGLDQFDDETIIQLRKKSENKVNQTVDHSVEHQASFIAQPKMDEEKRA